MFCSKCGQQIDDNAAFCPNCGNPIQAQQPQPQQAPPQQNAYYQPPQGDYQQPMYANPYQQAPVQGQKNKLVAGLLGIFLGSLGIHKFYLGYTKPAVIMLLVSVLLCWTGIAPAAMGIIGLIEGILYLTKNDAEFFQTYEANQKEWF